MRNFLIKTISSFFYIGYLPLVPGTFASLAALLMAWFLKDRFVSFLSATVCFTALGFMFASKAEEIWKKKDAKCIVIDEISGMFISLLFLPLTPVILFCAFVLFRGFDAAKVYPADKLQHLPGSRGIMLDDIVAGIYSNLILQFVLRFASCSIS